ncbi:2OG-Fe(II) oxygenase [Glaciimonas sp. GG7]
MHTPIAQSQHHARITDDLIVRGWSYQADFLPADLVLALAAECRMRADQGVLVPAGVGRGAGVAVNAGVRGDSIAWLDAGYSAACDRYLGIMETLREALNQTLYLGLEEYETHFAQYPPGAFYQKHIDRFRDNDRRTVSVVLYLNQGWLPEHGGALRLHMDGQHQDILPLAGSLALFLSADMPHEVLPATRERLSLTGWFKRR